VEGVGTRRAGSIPEALNAWPRLAGKSRRVVGQTSARGARLGHALEPVIAPLGFDWKIGVGLVGAFAAREVFVSTMGVVYGLGDAVDDQSVGLRERIRAETHADGRPVEILKQYC